MHCPSSEDDIGSKDNDLRGGKEAFNWNYEKDDNNDNDDNDDSDYNERKSLSDHDINKCEEAFKNNNGDVWKKKKKENNNGKRKDTVKEKEEEEEELEVEEVSKKEKASSGKQGINQKKSAGFWMKNQKKGVLLE